ncbi:hypothetical protein MLD52_22300 [Puniceicoccaceae bacterium K14]|nr:hypothetical protein [Puniceicoccaceae bacterium K14]
MKDALASPKEEKKLSGEVEVLDESKVLKLIQQELQKAPKPMVSDRTEVKYIGGYLENYSVHDITTAIQQAVRVSVRRDEELYEKLKLELAYHEETSLLMMSGPDVSMRLAVSTLSSLDWALTLRRAKATEEKHSKESN